MKLAAAHADLSGAAFVSPSSVLSWAWQDPKLELHTTGHGERRLLALMEITLKRDLSEEKDQTGSSYERVLVLACDEGVAACIPKDLCLQFWLV